MGPTKKTYVNTKRRTLNPAPPIHTLRKSDPFDKLLNPDSSKSNIFQSSSEGNNSGEDPSIKPKFFGTNTTQTKTNPLSTCDDSFILANMAREIRRQERKKKLQNKGHKNIKKTKNEERKLKVLAIKKFSPTAIIKPKQGFTSTPLIQTSKILELSNICSPIQHSRCVNNLTRKFKNLQVLNFTEMDISKDAQIPNKNVQDNIDFKAESILSVHESPSKEKSPESSLQNMSCDVFGLQKTKIQFEKSQNIIIDEASPYKSTNFSVSQNDEFLLSSTPKLTLSKHSQKFVLEKSPFMSPINISKRLEPSSFESTWKFSLSTNVDSSSYKTSNLALKSSISEKIRPDLEKSLIEPTSSYKLTSKTSVESDSEKSSIEVIDSISSSYKLTSKHSNLSNLTSKTSILEKISDDSEKSPIELVDSSSYKLASEHSNVSNLADSEKSIENTFQTLDDSSFHGFELSKNISHKKSEPKLIVKENSFEQTSEESECSFEQDSESSYEPSPSEMSKSFMDELALENLSGFDDDYYDHSPTRRSRNLPLYETSPLEPLPENQEYFEKIEKSPADSDDSCKTPPLRIKKRLSKERSPTRRSNISRPTIIPELNKVIEESENNSCLLTEDDIMPMENFVLPAGKKYRRSLSIIRHLDGETSINAPRGRNYEFSIEQVIKLQTPSERNEMSPINILKKRISIRRTSLLKQFTPPPRRRSRMALQLPSTPNLFLSRNTSILKESFLNSPRLNSINLGTPEFQRLMTKKSHNISHETTVEQEDSSEVVFLLCTPEQNEPMEFNDILPSEAYTGSTKIGEGVYGEVFFVARENRKNVLKIIPIEGDFLVNDEKQKTYNEIYSELLITRLLNELRGNMEGFLSTGFAELIQAKVIRGSYPKQLISLWEEYDREKGSDNDNPSIFGDNQLFLILELAHAGTDLESYSFSTARQALSIFKQIAFNLAVAESCMQFEHRDLHWGNILISGTTERQMTYKIQGDEYKIATNGVKATIIDFTLSRITFCTGDDETPIYYDVGKEPDMFIANGDYQFDIYRHMRKDLNNEWSQYQPKTNVRWLHYVLDKMIKKVKYRRKTAKVHKDSMKTLADIESWILDCDNCLDVGVKLAE